MTRYSPNKIISFLILIVSYLCCNQVHADIVKPALIEIKVNQVGEVDIEARVSIEALLTGINNKYKNTIEAPNADEYDVLRKLKPDQLKANFFNFEQRFIDEISLWQNKSEKIKLDIVGVYIPEPGYTKVPRISLIKLKGRLAQSDLKVTWYYPSAFGDNAVRLKQVDEVNKKYHWSEWQWLKDDKASKPFPLTIVVAKKPLYEVITNYIVLGFRHIVPKGLDHILFILGLFFFTIAIKPLILQITMFTVAHSLTLGLSSYGLITLPSKLIEPLIALSIVYIGLENILTKRLKISRLFLVFLFGLLHGLGFASVLSDFGLPKNDFITALLSFNVGVELAQLSIILILYLLIGKWYASKPWYRASISTPVSLIISTIGLYWFIQRLDLNFI